MLNNARIILKVLSIGLVAFVGLQIYEKTAAQATVALLIFLKIQILEFHTQAYPSGVIYKNMFNNIFFEHFHFQLCYNYKLMINGVKIYV